MAKKVPADNLRAACAKIFAEYGADVQADINDLVKSIAKKGVQAVKGNARSMFGGTGKYASGWTSQVETGRISAKLTIYNKDVPGLPHLLENGHANRGGGRTPGRAHIKPVEEELVKQFEQGVKSKL